MSQLQRQHSIGSHIFMTLSFYLEIVPHDSDPVTLHYDSISIICHVKNVKYHRKTKYIDVKYNFIRNGAEEVVMEHDY